MYTVLLADDEDGVLNVLKGSLDWQELGVDTLLTAQDGAAALELFSHRRIDLLVTDIRMPKLDGIELIRRVRALQPDCHFVLLTAYGEFQYAQEAIRLGVDNYLLKPVAREEVAQTLRSVLDSIYRNRRSSETSLRENTLRRWATGAIGAEELGERAAVLGLNLYHPAYCVLCMMPRGGASLTSFRASCTALLQMQCQCDGFWDEKGRYALILCGKSLDIEGLSAQIEELAAYEQAAGHVLLAFGTATGQYELLHASYQAACDALETAAPAVGRVVAPLARDAIGFDADLLAEELRTLFFDMKGDCREAGFRHLAEKLYRSRWDETAFTRLCRSCVHVLTQEFPMQENLADQIYRQSGLIPRPQNGEEGRTAAVQLLRQTETLFDRCFAAYSPAVQHMIRTVRSSVLNGEGLSIKELAASGGVTPAYLGHLFKKETGTFFNDYLLRCKLERSVVYLHNPNRKIKDIAESIGFASTSYYVKCFREYKGVSPAKYRQTWGGGL